MTCPPRSRKLLYGVGGHHKRDRVNLHSKEEMKNLRMNVT